MISPHQFSEFSRPYCEELIVDSISGMSIPHICGNTNHLLDEMAAAGADA